MRETYEEQEEREEREDDMHERLVLGPRTYRHASLEQNICVGEDKYSIQWILYYAKARNAGIACMYTASMCVNDIVFNEYHEVEDRRTDYLLLWQAQLYLKTKQKKGQKYGVLRQRQAQARA